MTDRLISLATATLEELDDLPGLEAEMAMRLVEARPFGSVDDVLAIEGISRGMLRELGAAGLTLGLAANRGSITASLIRSIPLLNGPIPKTPVSVEA